MVDEIDKANETELQKEKLQATPDIVSTESSTRTLGEVGVQEGSQKEHDDHEMMGGIKSDLNTIRETFSLQGVPRKPTTSVWQVSSPTPQPLSRPFTARGKSTAPPSLELASL